MVGILISLTLLVVALLAGTLVFEMWLYRDEQQSEL